MNSNFRRCQSAAMAMLALFVTPGSLPAALADRAARDMYYQQLNEPSQSENTGMSYWIELRRNGKLMRVDSRFAFRSGDKIKFHITPNVDGHAHIVMLSGSSGAKSVLFPVPGKDATNVVHRGKDQAVPSSSFIVFDQKKGREHLRIAISRKNVNTAQFLKPQSSSEIAMANISSNPAIDPTDGRDQIKISMPEDSPTSNAASTTATASLDSPPVDAIPNDYSRDMFREDSVPHHVTPHHPAPQHASAHHSTSSASHGHAHHAVAHGSHGASVTPPPAPPTIVVLNTNANEDLYADISLEHN